MAETAKYPLETEMGCGFMAAIFQLRRFKPRNAVLFQDSPHNSKRQLDSSKSAKPLSVQGKNPAEGPSNYRNQYKGTRVSDAARSSTSSSNNSTSNKASQLANSSYTRGLADQRKLDQNGTFYRASMGNVMLLGHLGNVKCQGKSCRSDLKGVVVTKKPVELSHQLGNIFPSSTNRLSPDVIKSLGNEKYKQGKYEEALALYDQAVSIDPSKACYYSNKSAALMGLGRLVEAVIQCREAVRIDLSYHNAHARLAKLYFRLGVAEKAVYHFKLSGHKASHEDTAQAQDLKNCLDRCIEAQNHGDWRKVLNESQIALSLGADAAAQIYAMKAKALMKLHGHQEAYTVLQNAPHFSIELYAEFLGSSATAGLLEVRALVYLANGRFEDAVTAVQQALELDSSKSMNLTAERVRLVASARLNGNRLFKGSRFSEALVAYNKGLEKDPYNSVLLCNRAACRCKLGQYEKAVEDCTAALLLRPSYSKARLRRANCNAQLEKWEAAIQDYEALMQEIPGDEVVSAALLESKIQLNKLHNGHRMEADIISNFVSVSSSKQIAYFTNTSGLSAVLFCSKMCSKQMLQLLEELCIKYPSVNFLKVEIEGKSCIAESEGVKVIPTFRIYRNGSQVEEIPGDDFDRLESSIKKLYCTHLIEGQAQIKSSSSNKMH